jgi:hypothetical protein
MFIFYRLSKEDGADYEQYGEFSVSDEEDKYRLFLGAPVTGTLGRGLRN